MAENETVTEQHTYRKVFFFWGGGGGLEIVRFLCDISGLPSEFAED